MKLLVTVLRRVGKTWKIKLRIEDPHHRNWKRMLQVGLASYRGMINLVKQVFHKSSLLGSVTPPPKGGLRSNVLPLKGTHLS